MRESDYADIQVNLMIGACRFRDLLKITGGDVAAAAVGYNAGISSSSFKQLMSGRAIESEEASNYPTKIFHLNEKAKKSPKKSNKPVAFIRQTSENEGESDAD